MSLPSAEALSALWNRALPPRWRIEPSTAQRQTLEHPLLIPEACFSEPDALLVAVKPATAAMYTAPSDAAHIHAILGQELDSCADLLDRSLVALRRLGYAHVVFGQDAQHYWPGCPGDVPWMNHVLKAAGFTFGARMHDLELDVAEFASTQPERNRCQTGPCGDSDIESLFEFLRREFPGRWLHDVGRKLAAESDPSFLHLLRLDGRVHGFALTQQDGCKLPIGGANRRFDLGTKWASLGPLGISKSLRGQGLGATLIESALKELRQNNARRTIVDWTGIAPFYQRFGFRVTCTYLHCSRRL